MWVSNMLSIVHSVRLIISSEEKAPSWLPVPGYYTQTRTLVNWLGNIWLNYKKERLEIRIFMITWNWVTMFFNESVEKIISSRFATSVVHSPFISTVWTVLKTYHWSLNIKWHYKLKWKALMDKAASQAQWKTGFRLPVWEVIYKIKQLPGLHTNYWGVIQVSWLSFLHKHWLWYCFSRLS